MFEPLYLDVVSFWRGTESERIWSLFKLLYMKQQEDMMKEDLIRAKDGVIQYDPKNPESINAALKIIMQTSQVAGFNMGAQTVNYKTGYKDGLVKGIIIGSLSVLALSILGVAIIKKRMK